MAEIDVQTISAMARDAEWLNADACAFILGMTTPAGKINRRAFRDRTRTHLWHKVFQPSCAFRVPVCREGVPINPRRR